MGVGHHVHPGDGQHARQFGRDMIRVSGEKGVDAGGKAIEIGAHLGCLGLVPGLGTVWCVVGDQIAIKRGIIGTPIFGGLGAAFAIHLEQDIAVARRLRPAKALEGAGFGGRLYMGDAVAIPQHFVGKGRGGAGEQQGEECAVHG